MSTPLQVTAWADANQLKMLERARATGLIDYTGIGSPDADAAIELARALDVPRLDDLRAALIDDEHDIGLAGLTAQADGSWLVDGNVTIRDLNRTLGWNLPDEDASTLAGLVLFESRTIPSPGQEFRFHDIRFRIVKREGNRLISLRLWAS